MNYFKFCGFILCLCFISCQHSETHNETILRAEKLLFSSPDSAYQLLDSIQHPKKMPKADYAAWCLNYTHARYKTDKGIPSDSVMLQVAINYYDNSSLKKQCGTAWYLMGCIYKNLNKRKEAMLALKQAEFLLNETTEENIKGLVNFKIGSLYLQDELFTESLKYYKKSLHNFIISKDKRYQAYAYRVIADMYVQFNYPFNSVMRYTDLAIKLAKEDGDSINYYNNITRKGELLYDTDYYRSKELLLQGFRFEHSQKSDNAAFLAYIYSKIHKPDSAEYYLKIAQSDKYSQNKTLIYLVKALIEKEKGNHPAAFTELKKAYNYRDSLSRSNISDQLHRIDLQYDLNEKEKARIKLEIDNQNKFIVIILLFILVLSAAVIILLIKNQLKKKQAEHEKKQAEDKVKQAVLLKEKQELEFKVQVKQFENNKKKELLRSKLQSLMENTLRFNQLKMVAADPDKQTDFIKEISTQFILSENEWEQYIDEINQLFDGEIKNLKTQFKDLTEADLIVISLICMEMDIANCCSLLNTDSNTIYMRRKRIKKHIGLDKEVDLEEWIHQHIIIG